MGVLQWIPSAQLSSYNIFRTAINNIDVLRSLFKVPHIFGRILKKIWGFRQIFIKVSNIKLHENPSSRSRVDNMGTDGRTDMTKVMGTFLRFMRTHPPKRNAFSLSARTNCGNRFIFNLSTWYRFKNMMYTSAVCTGRVAIATAFQNITW